MLVVNKVTKSCICQYIKKTVIKMVMIQLNVTGKLNLPTAI